MYIVLITALGVGGATIFGAAVGFLFKDLTKKCIFPPIINDASDVLRILGNVAAHGDDFEYDSSIVNEMINFTQIIIEYVYVIPYKIQQIKDTIDKQK